MDKGKHKSQDQIAFHPGHSVFGIDFINDPLLQGRLFSYTDRQLIRLGGPNFQEIAINRSLAPVQNDNVAAIRVQAKESLGGFVLAGNHRPLTFNEVNNGNKQWGS